MHLEILYQRLDDGILAEVDIDFVIGGITDDNAVGRITAKCFHAENQEMLRTPLCGAQQADGQGICQVIT